MKQIQVDKLLETIPLETLQAAWAERRVRDLEVYRTQLQLGIKQVDTELAALRQPQPRLKVTVLGVPLPGMVVQPCRRVEHTKLHQASDAPALESLLSGNPNDWPRMQGKAGIRLLSGDPDSGGKSDKPRIKDRPAGPVSERTMYRSLQTHCARKRITRRALRHSHGTTYKQTVRWMRRRWGTDAATCEPVLDKYISAED